MLIKWFLSLDMSFHSIFLYFFLFFLSSICCGAWLCSHKTIDLFVGFRVSDSNDGAVLIKQINIKSLFVNKLIQI